MAFWTALGQKLQEQVVGLAYNAVLNTGKEAYARKFGTGSDETEDSRRRSKAFWRGHQLQEDQLQIKSGDYRR
jgi:hypothetical protein